ncbi:hypothetical protein G4G27_19990 [Sphingomonas sp. So64.6b]|uniref:hypothetical protein n=1 Tax=Sphingomonas sp. So64.6b TaxID=2997354 RepID=UPI0016028443|nr:hypothetical protein [Sphingomonas sp. So64.6b]QNA86006.1 hypothetical protein G4G27_19990 [Sphingomonas sp. So64.6b]
MTRLYRVLSLSFALLAMPGCATRQVALAPPPPPMVPVPLPPSLPMPAGAHPGMAIPVMLGDGSYPTPNRDLSAAASVWHLRAGLNFAALACRGPQAGIIVANYNAMLTGRKTVLAEAERSLAAEYRAIGGAVWRDSYDDAMTRLYNYYAQAPARTALCDTADRILAEAVTVPAESFTLFAAARLPELDRSFTDFYRAYDAWRTQRQPSGPIIALVSNTAQRLSPRIEIDPAIFRMP